jgi:DNA polymerase III delta prime subunit
LVEIVGNYETVQVCKDEVALPPEERDHSFIITGFPGCGKTMLAQVYARALGCDPTWGFYKYTPALYGRKEIYEEIVHDSYKQGMYEGSYKILQFDEAQRMPIGLVAKLLEKVEDPEPWCIYIIVIVEVPKSLEWRMVESRCVPLEMRPLNQAELAQLLTNCAKKFGKAVPDKVVDGIWQRVGGIPRDAIVRLGMVRNTLPDL